THAYLSGGNFTVTLTVKDSGSPQQTATSQKLVKIPTSLAASFVLTHPHPKLDYRSLSQARLVVELLLTVSVGHLATADPQALTQPRTPTRRRAHLPSL